MTPEQFHPDLRRLAHFLPRQVLSETTLPILRGLQALASLRRSREVEVVSLAAGVRVRLFRPSSAPGRVPALLWIHGGGYVLGRAHLDDAMCRQFTERLGIVVASVDYRLAPELADIGPGPAQAGLGRRRGLAFHRPQCTLIIN